MIKSSVCRNGTHVGLTGNVCQNDTTSLKIKDLGGIMAAHSERRSERKETRLVARTSTEVQELIQRAADYSGATLFSIPYWISNGKKRRDVIERTETLHLSMAGADAMLTALENPPKANKKLLKAAQHYKGTVNVSKKLKKSLNNTIAKPLIVESCELNQFLQQQARQKTTKHISKTYVACLESAPTVVIGYHTLVGCSVNNTAFSQILQKNTLTHSITVKTGSPCRR